MVRRSLSLSLRVLAWLIASLVVIGTLLVWRLASGPISLAPLTPYLERTLSPDDGPLAVQIGGTELRLAGGEIGLVGVGVRGIDPDGAVVFELPEVAVELSPEALLLHGVVAPTRLVAAAPSLALVRDHQGRIGVRGLDVHADETPFEIGPALAGYLLQAPDPAAPLSYLRQVEIAGADLLLEDQITGQSFRADDAVLVLERRPDALMAELAFDLEQSDHVVEVRVLGWHMPGGERIAFDLGFAGLRPNDLAGFGAASPVALDGLDLTIDGDVTGEVALDGTLSPLEFTLTAGEGTIELPELLAAPIALAAGRVRGTIGERLQRLEIERLYLAAEGAEVNGVASLRWGDDGLALTAEIEAEGVRVRDLERFWPLGAGRRAREWVVGNITEGIVPRAFARLDLRPDDIGRKSLRDDALSGGFDFEDLTIRYFGSMPPVSGVSGRASFTGQDMRFEVRAGGTGRLRVQEGTVTITGIGMPGRETTQLEIALDVEGPTGQALALLDHPPLGFASDLGLDPAKVAGRARTDLRLGLPLHREVSAAELRVAADAELRETEAQDLFGGLELRAGVFALTVDRQGMDLEGQASVEGVPLEVSWRENFGAGVEVERRYRLEGLLDEASLASLGVASPVPIGGGGIWFHLMGSERAGTRTLDADLDLAPAALALPRLGWTKAAGEPGQLMLTAVLPPEGPFEIPRFELVAAGLQASGSLILEREPLALRVLDLERFRHQEQRGSARVRREGAGYRITLDADSLDLDPLLEGAEARNAEPDTWPVPLLISARAGEVIAGDARLSEVTAELARDEEGWRSADVRGHLPSGGRVELTLFPEGAERHLRLVSSNAGELLRMLDQSHQVQGGNLTLDARLFRQQPDLSGQGRLQIDGFTLLDAPMLARLLTLASFTGIGNLLGGQGIFVDRLELPFELADQVLVLDEGRLSGSQLGLTVEGTIDLEREQLDLDGTVVPIYTLNRVIGRIPVIGDFLAGSEGEGAFAATYSIEGPRAEPQITVNPLAVLAPGFIRELFSGILGGTLQPPDMPDNANR